MLDTRNPAKRPGPPGKRSGGRHAQENICEGLDGADLRQREEPAGRVGRAKRPGSPQPWFFLLQGVRWSPESNLRSVRYPREPPMFEARETLRKMQIPRQLQEFHLHSAG